MNKTTLIKVKLAELGKKQVDLLKKLNERGLIVTPSTLSNAINGRLLTPQGTKIRTECLYILDEWEKEARV